MTSEEHSENNFEHTGRNIFQLPWTKAIHRDICVEKLHIKSLKFLIIAFVIKEFSVPEILLYYRRTHYFFLTLSTWSIFILFSFNSSNLLDVLKYFYHSFYLPNVPFMFRICSFRNVLFFILFFFFLLALYQRQSTTHPQSLTVVFFMQGSERFLQYTSFQLILYFSVRKRGLHSTLLPSLLWKLLKILRLQDSG